MGFLPASGKSLKTPLAWDLDVEKRPEKPKNNFMHSKKLTVTWQALK